MNKSITNLATGETQVVPMTSDEISEARAAAPAALWESIKAERDRRKVEAGYTTAGKWFHSDQGSRTQQLGLVAMGSDVPPVPWKTLDGSFITMSPVLAKQILVAAATSDITLHAHAEALKAAVYAAADPLSVDLGGWPLGYGES